MLKFALIALVCLVVACAVLVLLLVALRVSFGRLERRSEERAARLRALFFELVMGEPREAIEAEIALHQLSHRDWEHARSQAFAMLPKLRGDSRARLIALLHAKGSTAEALAQLGSMSAVRRCRGAFALGVLGDAEHTMAVAALLHDNHFLVRRVAVRALGNLRAVDAVGPLLELGREEPRLARDLIYALHRIGPAASPRMREELQSCIVAEESLRSGELVATVLGLLGDYSSRATLVAGLDSDHPALAAACARALGAICAPDTEPALIAALDHPFVPVRAAVAGALGSMGSAQAVEPLAQLVEMRDPVASREAAVALVSLGAPGLDRMRESGSPYAVEAVALAELRSRR